MEAAVWMSSERTSLRQATACTRPPGPLTRRSVLRRLNRPMARHPPRSRRNDAGSSSSHAPNTVVVMPRTAPLDRSSLWYLFTALGLILGYLAHDLVATPADAIAPEPAPVVREVPAAPPTPAPRRRPRRGCPSAARPAASSCRPRRPASTSATRSRRPTVPSAAGPTPSPTVTPTLVACDDARPGAICQIRPDSPYPLVTPTAARPGAICQVCPDSRLPLVTPTAAPGASDGNT